MVGGNGGKQGFWATIGSVSSVVGQVLYNVLTNPYVLILAIASIFIWIIWSALISPDLKFLQLLQDVAVARGLITFLIALGTVAIAIILALYPVISVGQDLEKRFTLAKEVLTLLIGVLGTIVGFYFGSSKESTLASLQVAPALISDEHPALGSKVALVSFLSGGSPPYTYSINFQPDVIAAIKDAVSQDGWIR